ncbi:hypothetical protein BH24ACT3_BH24ACT3_11770 [soil metagenome]
MVAVATAQDAFEAKVIAARLGSDGIVWQLRGGVDGVYPIGTVEVLVTEDDADEARALLAATDLDGVDGDDDEPVLATRWLPAMAVVAVVLFTVFRVMSLI